MQRIQSPTGDKMKIEHFKPQNNSNRDLEYRNLLGACKGGEGSPPYLQHCDTAKGESEITVNLLDNIIINSIKFTLDGFIFCKNPIVNDDINNVLKLNIDKLKREREEIIKALKSKIKRKFGKKRPQKSYINAEIQKWEQKVEGKYMSFCQVAIYYLQKELKRSV